MYENSLAVKGLVVFFVSGLFLNACMHAPDTNPKQQASQGYSPYKIASPGPSYGVQSEDKAGVIPKEIQAAVEIAKSKTSPVKVSNTIPMRNDTHSRNDIFYVTEYGAPIGKKVGNLFFRSWSKTYEPLS